MRKELLSFLFLLIFQYFFVQFVNAQDVFVTINTNYGDIKVKLYDETPIHQKEFLKLVSSGHFNGTLFYRVIENFVIQGGSSDSKNAPAGKHIGYGTAHNISSEFNDKYFHKRGALCAPRQPENINHFRMSDISQFYIVHGRVYTNEELDLLEKRVNNPILRELRERFYLPHKPELDSLRNHDPHAFNSLIRDIKAKIDFEFSVSDHLKFSSEQRKAYTSIGGLPDLDGDYTVFGEVVEGIEVVSRIAGLKTDENDRPISDVVINID